MMSEFKRCQETIMFEHGPVIISSACVAGKKESEGPLAPGIDYIETDAYAGEKNWEAAESAMQTKALQLAMDKAGYHPEDIDVVLAGDLLSQTIASAFGLKDFQIPLFGLYGACSTIGEALGLGAMLISGKTMQCVAAVTSSHFAGAEKEFRFPLNYGNQRPLSATWTVTGSGAFIIADREKSAVDAVSIKAVTIGTVTDFGVKDSMNMGACMAPAAADTLEKHFNNTKTTPADFDWIFTGDLGMVGHKILVDLMQKTGFDISEKHRDCGMEIYDNSRQDTHAGGSGCACSAVTLAAYILPQMLFGKWHRILFVPTGALLSQTSFQEGQSIPGIAHAVELYMPSNPC